MSTAIQAERQQELGRTLASNAHTIVVMDPSEFVDFAITVKKQRGLSDAKIVAFLNDIVMQSPQIGSAAKALWQSQKSNLKNYGSYAPVFSDALALQALALEMHRGGDVLSKYRVTTYNGKNYIVLKGYAGLRKQLNGTRYFANNPKIVSMAVGKLGVASKIKGGFILSVVFSVGFHSVDQLMNDKATWHDFVGGVAVDAVAAGVGAWAAWAVVSTFVGGTAMVAIGPIVAVVFVGAAVTYALGEIESRLQFGNKLAGFLREAERRVLEEVDAAKREVKQGLTYAEEGPVGFFHRLFAIPYLGGSFR